MKGNNPLAALCAHVLSNEQKALQSEMRDEMQTDVCIEPPEIKTSKSSNAAKLKRKAKKRKNVRARRKK